MGPGDPENRGESYGRDAYTAGPGECGQSQLPGSEAGLSWRRPEGKHTLKTTELKTVNLETRDLFPWAFGFYLPWLCSIFWWVWCYLSGRKQKKLGTCYCQKQL